MSTLPKHSSTSEGAKPVIQSQSDYEESKVPLDEEKAMEIVSNSNGYQTEVMMESTNFGSSCYPEKGMNM